MVTAFKIAIFRINELETPGLLFAWPQYLADFPSLAPSFLQPLGGRIINSLQHEAILLSENKTFEAPTNLMVVPPSYRWSNGDLLLDHESLRRSYLSREYHTAALAGLRVLRVRTMTFADFLSAFKKSVYLDDRRFFCQQSQEWHSMVAGILIRASHRWSQGRYNVAANSMNLGTYPIIPLRDGTWTSALGLSGKLFMDKKGQSFAQKVPQGIEINIVDEVAAADPSRLELFQALGVPFCEEYQICKLILQTHRGPVGLCLPTNTWISHAVYLFEADYKPRAGDALCFVKSPKGVNSTERLYINFGSVGSSIRRFFPPSCDFIKYLHPWYENAVSVPHREAWWEWLLLWPNILHLPPLEINGKLSTHFRYILTNHGSKVLLKFLKDHQSEYRAAMIPERERHFAKDSACDAVRSEIGSLFVATDDGNHAPLKETALPVLRNKADGCLQILDLEDPEDPGWNFLHNFGVFVEADLRFHLQRLKYLKRTRPTQSQKELSKIYESLQQNIQSNKEMLM